MKKAEEISAITQHDTSKDILMHHFSSFKENDLKAVMSDYTDESILITQEATYTGLTEIETFFAQLITHFPQLKSSLELDKMAIHGGLVYIVWHAKTPSLHVPLGSDTFIIEAGKIRQQTFAGQLNFL